MKSQMSFPLKLSVIILSIAAFMLIIYYYTSFTSLIKEERAKTQFRTEALNVLGKLVTSDECLAYSGFVNSSKPILDISKIEEFVSKYQDLEPDCAKALDFDYSVEIIQLPKEVKTYPGEILEQTECGEAVVGIAYHFKEEAKTHYIVCENDGWKKCCGGELDTIVPTEICGVWCNSYDCSKYVIDTVGNSERMKECQEKISKGEKVCCLFSNCIPGEHPIIILCYNIDPEKDCQKSSGFINAMCGAIALPTRTPTTKTIQSSVQEKIWSFSVSSGVSSFSPEKAKWDEIEVSYPVIIRYDPTFSTEGIIKIKAVRGELEKFVSLLEDICKKAENGEKAYFAEKFYFSYTVKRDGDKICMLDRCKIFSCKIPLEIPEKIERGERYIRISYDASYGKIRVLT